MTESTRVALLGAALIGASVVSAAAAFAVASLVARIVYKIERKVLS